MSKVAGIILVILGGYILYLGIGEIRHLEFLTRNVAYVTAATGAILVLIGLAHFRAPHKAFLLSIPFLILLQGLVFAVAHTFYDNKRWLYYQILVAVVSILTVWLSYRGYLQKKESGKAAQ